MTKCQSKGGGGKGKGSRLCWGESPGLEAGGAWEEPLGEQLTDRNEGCGLFWSLGEGGEGPTVKKKLIGAKCGSFNNTNKIEKKEKD